MDEETEVGQGLVPISEDVEEAGSLIRLALEKNTPVEVLERLVALQERVSDRNARTEFFDALAKFQDEMPEIRKSKTAKIATRTGGEYSYTYAPLEEITRAIREPLHQLGLSFAWTTEGMEGGNLNVVCVLRHIGGHEERSTFPVSTVTSAAMSEAQKHGAALTYGKRQSLTSVLGLTTADDDVDGVDPKDATPVTEDQMAELRKLIKEAGADEARLLAWVGVESFEEIPEGDLPRLRQFLEEKKARKAEKAGTP